MTSTNALPPSERPALLWGAVCLPLLGIFLTLLSQAHLDSSVLAMLPKQTLGAILPDLNEGSMQRPGRQVVWLVNPGRQPDLATAQGWLVLLQKSYAPVQVKSPMNADNQQAWRTFLW